MRHACKHTEVKEFFMVCELNEAGEHTIPHKRKREPVRES